MKLRQLSISTFILFLFFVVLSCGQPKAIWLGTIEEVDGVTIVKNPSEPLGKSAGRQIRLSLVLQIKDVGDSYYLENPHNITVAPDGSIWINEKEQFLQFSGDGSFLKNYFKRGQGPSEVTAIRDYFIGDDAVFIYNQAPPKILKFSFVGDFKEETVIREKLYFPRFICCLMDKFYFVQSGQPEIKGNSSMIDIKQNLISIAQGEDNIRELASFYTKEYWVKMSWGGRGVIHVDEMKSVPFQNQFLVISHTQEYLLHFFDLDSNQVVRKFTREYSRVKLTKEFEIEKTSGLADRGEPIKVPGMNYHDDVRGIFVNNDQILTMTSTVEKEKGTLFDVFDIEGKYIDSFFIRLPERFIGKIYGRWHMTFEGEHLYTIEWDKDGAYSINKYRLKDES